jgi:dolichol kinase
MDYGHELRRKAFHLSSLIFPLIYFVTSRLQMTIIMMIVVATTIYIDRMRHYNEAVKELVETFFGSLLREREASGTYVFSGLSFMMAGFFITALFFPKGIAVASWLVLIISDALAAIVGMRIGKPTNHGKSIEGAVTFFISALLIGIFSYFLTPHHASFFALFLACLITSAVEYYSFQIGIDDNFTIPVTFATTLTLFSWIIG